MTERDIPYMGDVSPCNTFLRALVWLAGLVGKPCDEPAGIHFGATASHRSFAAASPGLPRGPGEYAGTAMEYGKEFKGVRGAWRAVAAVWSGAFVFVQYTGR